MRAIRVLGVILAFAAILFPILACSESPTSETNRISTYVAPYYDQYRPSSVTDKEALFHYLRSVTGMFTGVQLSTPPLRTLPEDFQREYMELVGDLNEAEYKLVLTQNGVDSKEALFDVPVRIYFSSPVNIAMGHGIVIAGRVLTVSHVIEDNFVPIVMDSPLRDLPLDLITIRYRFMSLEEEPVSKARTFYKLRKDITYPEYLVTWLSSAMDSPEDVFSGLGSTPIPKVVAVEWEKLQPGTFLYVVMHDGIREATVAQPEQLPKTTLDSFLVVNLLDGHIFRNGDSGAPVFAIKNGRAYFVGLVEAADLSRPYLGVVLSGRFAWATLPLGVIAPKSY